MTNIEAQEYILYLFGSYCEKTSPSNNLRRAVAMAVSALSVYPNGSSVNDDILSGKGLSPLGEGNPAKMVTPPVIPTRRR